MERIASFGVNHEKMSRGVFVSRIDTIGDNYITTLINCNPKNLYFEKCFFDNEYYYVVTELNNFFEYVIDIETLEYVL